MGSSFVWPQKEVERSFLADVQMEERSFQSNYLIYASQVEANNYPRF